MREGKESNNYLTLYKYRELSIKAQDKADDYYKSKKYLGGVMYLKNLTSEEDLFDVNGLHRTRYHS